MSLPAASKDTYFSGVISLHDLRAEVHDFFSSRFAVRNDELDDERDDIISRTPEGHGVLVDQARELQRALATAGLSGVHVPIEYGGRGLTHAHAKIIEEELRHFDAPSIRPLGIGMHLAVSTLLSAGSEEQKIRFIPALIRADELWCQLFSEPDAGSDLASLRCRAVRDGDEFVIDGQKVWSSYASDANFGMLLARTDPDALKPQMGITMFILPIHARGVTVRPLIDIAGGRHFNEVFLEGVRLPASAVIGEVNKGWGISQGTLGGERSGYMGGSGANRRQRQVIKAAVDRNLLNDPNVRQLIARVVTSERILEWVRDSFVAGQLMDGHPAAGSMMKLSAGTLEQFSSEVVTDIMGASGIAWDRAERDGDIVSHALNASRQSRIAGGSHEIQRNLLGERLLGLPRDLK